MKNYKIETSFVGPRNWGFYDIFLIFVQNCLLYNDVHDFSVWLRPDSNPADINRFRSDTGKI